MIELERVVKNKIDEYLEIPLSEVVDDFMVTFHVRTNDIYGHKIQTITVSKELLHAHLKYMDGKLICRVPLKKLI